MNRRFVKTFLLSDKSSVCIYPANNFTIKFLFFLSSSDNEKRLKRQLRKTRALLSDASAALAKHQGGEGGSRQQMAALANALDDAQFAAAAATKAKKRVELEVQELQQQLDELTRAKQEVGCLSLTDLDYRLKPNRRLVVKC